MYLGKTIRLERIFNRQSKRTIIIPMDHGVTLGAVEGLVDIKAAVDDVARGGADAVLMHKGLVRAAHRGSGRDIGLILHLSASTTLSPYANSKTLVSTVEEGLRQGADAVSVHINLGDPNDRQMLGDLGQVAASCAHWGMPLLAMMYARGPQVENSLAPQVVAHCARVAAELGADIVKVPYTGDVESFHSVVQSCCVPVVIAGGERIHSDRQILHMVYDAQQAGSAGISLGRNVFQHPRRRQLVAALRAIVHEDADVETALKLAEA